MHPVTRHVVFLRAVNVGRANRIRMVDLRGAFEAAGFVGVRTLLQSGNVVLDADADAAAVQAAVREVLADSFGLTVPVVLRTADEIRDLVADDPLRDVATDGSRRFVVFATATHDPAALPVAAPPEVLVARGRDLHAWCPAGARDSPLMAALGRLGPEPVATVRNWNTVTKVHAMLDA